MGYPSKGVGTDPAMLQAGAGSVIESWWTLKGWDLLTFVDLQLLTDLPNDSDVANDHDAQGGDVEGGEGEHVVDGFLPVRSEAPVSNALGEVPSRGRVQVKEEKLKW